MFTKKRIRNGLVLTGVLLTGILLVGLGQTDANISGSGCPQNTTVGETSATLVGEITDHGGDPNLVVKFQYGESIGYGQETPSQSHYGVGLFCSYITGLKPGATYYYRAVAQNSAGTSYGERRSFNTRSSISVDLRVNNSKGPITRTFNDYVTLSWSSNHAVSCQASGDWSGSKQPSGSQQVQLNSVRTHTFTITCTGSGGQQASDNVQVHVNPKPPVVITKPAVVTN